MRKGRGEKGQLSRCGWIGVPALEFWNKLKVWQPENYLEGPGVIGLPWLAASSRSWSQEARKAGRNSKILRVMAGKGPVSRGSRNSVLPPPSGRAYIAMEEANAVKRKRLGT